MLPNASSCLAEPGVAARPVHAVRPAALAACLEALPASQAAYARDAGFKAETGAVCLLPGTNGIEAALFGLGSDPGHDVFGKLPDALPQGAWQLQGAGFDPDAAQTAFLLGAYRFTRFKAAGRAPAQLVRCGADSHAADAVWLARDLINTPANHLGPRDLAQAVQALGARHNAPVELIDGAALEQGYPALAAVGAGSDRAPVVAVLRWQGSGAGADAGLVSVCGKGVCFDTGGYDLKPSSAMLRMKKDMGGAAIALGLAHMIMAADLPVRFVLRIGCVENSVSGNAMRPSDILDTRRGLHVEIGNTDAEGRLVLADLLAEASDEQPDILLDFATLTGAARAALGPELPALFCNDEVWAGQWAQAAQETEDPVWRLPLWPGYDPWLKSPVADLNNISSKPFAGAIIGALFLQRFLRAGTRWAHLDTYAWSDATRPAHPEGGDAQSMRAAYAAVLHAMGLRGNHATAA